MKITENGSSGVAGVIVGSPLSSSGEGEDNAREGSGDGGNGNNGDVAAYDRSSPYDPAIAHHKSPFAASSYAASSYAASPYAASPSNVEMTAVGSPAGSSSHLPKPPVVSSYAHAGYDTRARPPLPPPAQGKT